MKKRVLDSWAILEWMQGRQPAEGAMTLLLEDAERQQVQLYMSAINVGEVYYFLRKHHSHALAQDWRSASSTLPMVIDVPSHDDIWDAALLKSQYAISYADAFAAALARKHNCPLVTGDKEFRAVPALSLEWLGS